MNSMSYTAACKEALTHNRVVLSQVLRELGFLEVVVEYSGGWDSGDVSDVSCKPESLRAVLEAHPVEIQYECGTYDGGVYVFTVKSRTRTLKAALDDFTMSWLEQVQPGWENNEGGSGSVTIDVQADCFTLSHTQYYQESTDYEFIL